MLDKGSPRKQAGQPPNHPMEIPEIGCLNESEEPDARPEFELQVEDTGVGIPADALPNIIDPYRQAHRDRGGTGLGLARSYRASRRPTGGA